MPARRFFIEGVFDIGDATGIAGADARKIVRVLRLGDGARVEVVDSAGTLFDAEIAVNGEMVTATLLERRSALPAERLHVDVAQALPKGQKMDFVVEKTTELGAGAILPFVSERSVVRDASAVRIERWRRLAASAARQCGRQTIPAISPPIAYDELLARFAAYDRVLFPWELAPPEALSARLPGLLEGAHRVLVVIGPEGGFSHDEADAAHELGAELLWLGPRILRTETAAMALLAVIGAFSA